MTEREVARRAAPLLARMLTRINGSDVVIADDTPGTAPSPGVVSSAITAPDPTPARPPVGSGATPP